MPAPYRPLMPHDWIRLEQLINEIFGILNEETTLSDVVSNINTDASNLKIVSDALSTEVSDRVSDIKYFSDSLVTVSNALSTEISDRNSDIKYLSDALILAGSASDLKVVSDALSTEISDRQSDELFLSDSIVVVSNALSDAVSDIALLGPGGLDTQVQFKNGTVLGGDAAFTWNNTTKALTIGSCAVLGPNSALFQPAADSTTFFQILDADGGTPILNVDTTNERVGIGTSSPAGPLHIVTPSGVDAWFRVSRPSNAVSAVAEFDTASTPTVADPRYYMGKSFSTNYFTIGRWNGSTAFNSFIIGTTGYVGIGGGVPAALLHLYPTTGDAWFRCSRPLTTVTAAAEFDTANTPSVGDPRYVVGKSLNTNYFSISRWTGATLYTDLVVTTGGDVGIGGETVPETLTEWTSTAPYLTLHNSTHEDAAGGRESRIIAKGEQSGGEETTLGYQEFGHDGAADDEKGYWDLYTNDGNDGTSPTKRVRVDSAGNMKIGDGGTTNYVNFAADGELTLFGTARVTKNIKLPLEGIGRCATAPTVTRLGNYYGYAFTINDDGYFTFESPHDRASGTDFDFVVYWYINEAYATNSGEIRWQITWSATPDGETEAVDAPTHSATVSGTDQNIPTTAKFLTHTHLTISGTNIVDNDVVGILMKRITLSAGANPTAEPVVVFCECYYTSDKLGAAT